MTILGIGGILNSASCAILRDGQLVAAMEEQRLTRQHAPGTLPFASMQACLQQAGITPDMLDCVAVARPFQESAETGAHLQLRGLFPNSRLVAVEHHAAHAASAFYPSPFDDAVVLTLDRVGDFRCGARWRGHNSQLELDKELYVPDSLGELYARVTELLGHRPSADEHKVQWMSVDGDERFVAVFESMFNWVDGDWPRLDRSWFDGARVGHGGFDSRLFDALGIRSGEPVSEDIAVHIAAGLQRAIERAVLRMAAGATRLCLAGGLGLNVLLVAALERECEVFVQPGSGNAGTAVGAVLHAWHTVYRQTSRVTMGNLCLGPEFSPEEIKRVLENCKLRFRYLIRADEMIELAIRQLNENQIVGWMHGRMEFGPRALGNRSILASPRNPYSTENLNVYIKHREPYRKFAASVTAEAAPEYFEAGPNARYLATVGRVRPAHRDLFASALLGKDQLRVHVVHREDNPLFYRLLEEAGRTTGLPVLYNTSFNLFGDPLVCSPRDAARSFYSSGIDAMAVGNFWLEK